MQGAERGATLTKRMLAFARRQELRPEIGRYRAPGRQHGRYAAAARWARTSRSPPRSSRVCRRSRVDPNQLELAILNLALNARDAMPRGGSLHISARAERVGLGDVPGLAPGDYVCIAVRDSGIGMDEVTLKRATEPFFTTKGAGQGTGLGLSMVDGLAAQSGGAMRIASHAGGGHYGRAVAPGDRAGRGERRRDRDGGRGRGYAAVPRARRR